MATDTKGVIRSGKPKDIQHNGHKIPKGYSEAVSRRIYNTMATYTTQWDIQRNGHKIPKGYSEAVSRRIYNTMVT